MSTKIYKKPLLLTGTLQLLLVLILGLVSYLGYKIYYPHKLPNNVPFQLVIDKNESIRNVARKLNESGMISSPYLMVALTRIMAKDRKVTAGLYFIKRPMSLMELIKRITNGKPDEISVTIIDGISFRQIRNYVDELPYIQHLTKNMTDDEIKTQLKIPYPLMEGLLYPSTYFIAPGQTDLEIYLVAYRLMILNLTRLWANKNNNANNYKDPYQILVMASLIQKETANKEDMYLISTVFNNRLRSKMRLQNDPAVFYGLGNRDKITRADFKIDTPYNTYLHDGLPPTPICTPSPHALDAAVNPGDDHQLFYFVAIGDGKTKFSTTYDEHNKAVKKYLKKPGNGAKAATSTVVKASKD